MKHFSYLLVLAFLMGFAQTSFGQFIGDKFVAGVNLGVTNYKGDLDDNFALKFTKPGVGGYLAYKLNPKMALRLTLSQGWMGATDAKASSDLARQRRNLSFRSPLTELALTFKYELFGNRPQYKYRPGWSPFVFAGVAGYYFNPQAQASDGNWYNLQPLGTEGQHLADPEGKYPDPYKRLQVSIPFGVGMRIKLSEAWDLHMEMGLRKTFTDYLDDVSGEYPDLVALSAQDPIAAELSDRIDTQAYPEGAAYWNGIRGDSNKYDWYVISMVTLTRHLGKKINPKFRPGFPAGN